MPLRTTILRGFYIMAGIEDKKKYAYNYYLQRGLTPVQAAAIVGNLAKESNFNTTVIGTADTKGSVGIGQWHSERLDNLKRFAGNNWQNLDKQLDFVLHELNTTEKKAYNKLLQAKTVEEATTAFMNHYERPSSDPKINRINDRIREALSVSGQQADTNFSFGQYDTKEVKPQYQETPGFLTVNQGEQQTAGEWTEPKEVSEAKTQLVQAQNEENFIKEFQAIGAQQQEIQQEQPNYLQSQELFTLAPTEQIQYNAPQEFQKGGQIPVSSNGVFDYPKEDVLVPTNGSITMRNVSYPILGISQETGQQILMQPNKEYFYPNTSNVLEIPQVKNKRFSK